VRLVLPDTLGAIFQYDTVDSHGSYSGHEKLKVTDRGCTKNDISVWLDGRIGGRITDAAGKPVKEMMVDIVNASDPDKSWSASTDANGNYEFRKVQPGLYLLGINLDWVPKAEYPYARTYYPGVVEQAQAKVITVGEGTKQTNYDLALPPRLKERTVEGTVLTADGKPAAGARILFELSEYPGKSLLEQAVVDAEGHFSAKLFDGLLYVMCADNDKNHSEVIELTPTDKTEPLKFVLNKSGYYWQEMRNRRKKQKR
jgi:hypothetical protein